ncbi:hypothetical protein GCM10023080_045270 [Streptomyces pseudoechinosporeus]
MSENRLSRVPSPANPRAVRPIGPRSVRIVVIGDSLSGPPGAHTGYTMTKPSAPRRHLPTSPFKAPVAPVAKHFELGDRVSHDQFGLGTIVGVEDGVAMLVDFGARQARIVSPYTRMDKL